MFISLQDLALDSVEFADSFAPGKVDFGGETRQIGNLDFHGRVELIEEDHGGKLRVQDIRLRGEFAGRFESPCSRCLEPVVADIRNAFDLLYRPLQAGAQGEEVSISEAETEIGFYQGDGIDTADVAREQVLLTLPVKTLCRPDCKGLCAHCGQNLNQGPCQCKEEHADPRWAALGSLRDQLKKS